MISEVESVCRELLETAEPCGSDGGHGGDSGGHGGVTVVVVVFDHSFLWPLDGSRVWEACLETGFCMSSDYDIWELCSLIP